MFPALEVVTVCDQCAFVHSQRRRVCVRWSAGLGLTAITVSTRHLRRLKTSAHCTSQGLRQRKSNRLFARFVAVLIAVARLAALSIQYALGVGKETIFLRHQGIMNKERTIGNLNKSIEIETSFAKKQKTSVKCSKD